jgi:orotate phosphoribosyltransferase
VHLIPTREEVLDLLRRTGGLRDGHFEYPSGLHANEHLQVALTMRHFETAKILSIGLSRLIRSNPELRAMIPELSVVAPATGGLPVAYGVSEALRTRHVYWAETANNGDPLRFRQFLEIEPREKVLLVDDLFRTGAKLTELEKLVQDQGGEVVGIAVLIYQPLPNARSFNSVPFYSLAHLDASYYKDAASCELCRNGVPLVKTWV